MDLVLIVTLNGLEKQEVVKTMVGKRTRGDSEPVRLDEVIEWYSEFSSGCSGFNKTRLQFNSWSRSRFKHKMGK